MGGSGGYNIPSKTLSQLEQEKQEQLEIEKFETDLNQYIKEYFQEVNSRDVEGINRHLETIKNALEKDIEGFVDLKFGGSVIKNTYSAGISDVDMLVQINNTNYAKAQPMEVLKHFKEQIEKRLPKTEVKIGKLAITVKFKSGHEIQLLPSIKTPTGYRIPRPGENNWSNVIRPRKFAEKLTNVNKLNYNKVVPLIKLMKNINAALPKQRQLSGYHLESLAIDAFKNPNNTPKTYKGMVEHFCRHAERAVLKPITDSTGQSVHVDTYLGNAKSPERQRASNTFKQLLKKMESANQSKSLDLWKGILGSK
ncbi:CBASS oligonucleotide cyclase [Bacillus pseudomycoides]|uniref:CBASS oligonucleotide cyclase n=1 Tax=Bacillus pseudomycoides TaxID=64104 RepID=UPI000BF8083A|nr:CBASS oligonucleotide cyclase [Bacillus pseudomycoides]PEP82114.1 tRNA nucleotidyltransferase [Bacillus pseudomycoides]PGF07738.1 tRNA nucleotidyltransferase [Bacillus pseudomycoides]